MIALGVAAFLAAHWSTGLQDVWARGMLTFDTLWYHGPFAARIAESGSLWGLHFTDPLYLNWFYPQNSELLHATGISLFDRDLFSPLVNFGWLGVALLAAWCIGRPYGVAPLSLVAVALVLDIGPMVPREAGTPANDIAPVALLLAAAAVLINAAAQARGAAASARTLHSGGPPLRDLLPMGALLVAGLAMGLALGTKLTIAGGVAAMAVGVPLIMPPGTRRKATLIFLGGVAATAAFWFIRNLIHSGNPLPWLGELGPIDLPGPDRGLEGRDNFTVSHYLFDPDTSLWSQYFFRPITNLLGPAWPLFLGLSAAGTVLAIVRPRTQTVRMLGAVTVVSAIAYLFTPLTAAGPEGQPLAFGINLRYLVPALALGLALLTLEPKLTPERFRVPLLIGGVLAMGLTSKYSDSAYIWSEPFASIPFAALIGLFMIGVPVGIALLARRAKALAIARRGPGRGPGRRQSAGSARTTISTPATRGPRTSASSSTSWRPGPRTRRALRWGSPAPAAPTTSTCSTATSSRIACSSSGRSCPPATSRRWATRTRTARASARSSSAPSTTGAMTTWSRRPSSTSTTPPPRRPRPSAAG